jgi:hypothetical protein
MDRSIDDLVALIVNLIPCGSGRRAEASPAQAANPLPRL